MAAVEVAEDDGEPVADGELLPLPPAATIWLIAVMVAEVAELMPDVAAAALVAA